jgi:uncharacterized protein YukE
MNQYKSTYINIILRWEINIRQHDVTMRNQDDEHDGKVMNEDTSTYIKMMLKWEINIRQHDVKMRNQDDQHASTWW